jgi:hypothetical protein
LLQKFVGRLLKLLTSTTPLWHVNMRLQVAESLQLRPEQLEQLGAAYEIYNSKRHQLCLELQQCTEQLQPLLGPHHNSSSAAAAAHNSPRSSAEGEAAAEAAAASSPSVTPAGAVAVKMESPSVVSVSVKMESPSVSDGSDSGKGDSSPSNGSAAAAAASAAGASKQMDWLLDLESAEAAGSLLQRMEHITDAISVIKLYMRNAYVNCLDKVQLARAVVHSWPYMMNVWVLCAVALGLHDAEEGEEQQQHQLQQG